MRWLATRLRWQDEPSGDIIVFAVFHEPTRRRGARPIDGARQRASSPSRICLPIATARSTERDRARSRAPAHAARDGQIFADDERAVVSRRLRRARRSPAACRRRKRSSWPAALRSTSGTPRCRAISARSSSGRDGAREIGWRSLRWHSDTIGAFATTRAASGRVVWVIASARSTRAPATTARRGSPTASASTKTDARVGAFGDVDETNSALGLLLAETRSSTADAARA